MINLPSNRCNESSLDEKLNNFEKCNFDTLKAFAFNREIFLEQKDVAPEYNLVKIISEFELIPSKGYQKPYWIYNIDHRYNNIFPWENHALTIGNLKTIGSEVHMGPEKYIAIEGPKPSNFKTFLIIIKETQCDTLVTLLEKGLNPCKCMDYWSQVKSEDYSKISDEVIMTKNDYALYKRKFKTDKQSFTQYHLEWPDHGKPDSTLFDKLLEVVNQTHKTGPIISHCSAGIGRTGTFIGTDSLIKALKVNPGMKINIAEWVLMMRIQRKGMVQTQAQMKAMRDAVARYLTTTPHASNQTQDSISSHHQQHTKALIPQVQSHET